MPVAVTGPPWELLPGASRPAFIWKLDRVGVQLGHRAVLAAVVLPASRTASCLLTRHRDASFRRVQRAEWRAAPCCAPDAV
jgi:hypothetical protein